jgi:pimeloyl-ACP methyl ester carboxylesterase
LLWSSRVSNILICAPAATGIDVAGNTETTYYIAMVSDARGASFVLIPGAGGMAWYWHRVLPLLKHVHREAIAVDLPGDDESAGLNDYAEIVVRAIGERSNVILVAQSLGGFTAPLGRVLN